MTAPDDGDHFTRVLKHVLGLFDPTLRQLFHPACFYVQVHGHVRTLPGDQVLLLIAARPDIDLAAVHAPDSPPWQDSEMAGPDILYHVAATALVGYQQRLVSCYPKTSHPDPQAAYLGRMYELRSDKGVADLWLTSDGYLEAWFGRGQRIRSCRLGEITTDVYLAEAQRRYDRLRRPELTPA